MFDAGLGRGRGPCGIEREVGVDRGLVRLWLVAALAVLGRALPELVAEVQRWRDAGASILGGCCGTGPAHIRALAAALAAV